MKQIDLAQELGINKSYVSIILSGYSKEPPEIRVKLGSLGIVNFKRENCMRGRCSSPTDVCATERGYQIPQ